jgi:hypothetical protein
VDVQLVAVKRATISPANIKAAHMVQVSDRCAPAFPGSFLSQLRRVSGGAAFFAGAIFSPGPHLSLWRVPNTPSQADSCLPR